MRCYLIAVCAAVGMQIVPTRTYAQQFEALFYATRADDALISFEQHVAQVNVIAPQSYRVDANGELTGTVPERLLETARRHGVRVMPLIVNPGWNLELFHALVNDSVARARMIAQMVELGKQHGFWGWQFDFEQIHINDRDALTAFYRETARALHAAGMKLSIAVYPDPDPRAEPSEYHLWLRDYLTNAYDLRALAEAADFISLMTYLQHTPRTPPGPVGGLPYIERVIRHAFSLGIPPEKLSLGIPFFSMSWSTNWSEERKGFSWSRGLSWSAAQELLQEANAKPAWDKVQGSSEARWEKGGTFEYAWIEDARAFAAKLELVRRYKLRGISVWRIGQEDTAVWRRLKR
jgi:spore germination protein